VNIDNQEMDNNVEIEVASNPDEQSNHTDEDKDEDGCVRTSSGRVSKPPTRINLHQCHLINQDYARQEYSIETAKTTPKNIIGFNNKQHHQAWRHKV
jgi:hypothetical protein